MVSLKPSDFRIKMPIIINGVKIPNPPTINQNRIVSCPVCSLSQGMRYEVNTYISIAAGRKIANDEINPSGFNAPLFMFSVIMV
jgi:hypothetical protein